MADWRDGAEYAPRERPDGFATPRTPPLSVAPEPPHLADGLPAQGPEAFEPAPAPTPPLDALVPSSAPKRDPHLPFGSGMSIHEGSAWGSAHAAPGRTDRAWDPTQPMVTSHNFGPLSGSSPHVSSGTPGQAWAPPDPTTQYPPPGNAVSQQFPTNGPSAATGQFSPSGSYPTPGPLPLQWEPQSRPPAAGNGLMTVVRTAGYALVIVLLAGMLIRPLSFVLLLSAVALSAMAPVAKQTLVRVGAIGAAAALVLGLLVPGDRDTIDAVFEWAQFACFVVLGADLYVVWKYLGKART
ncbi:hypothetical protein [Aestuariimicrobium sp. T2.26MG-19.2B]|uniref:hypothetical protein n=1 Tax=Aestuariimicrobium sp. T2.26MG-19.2B TaxID=3040679 RepID=UPI00253F772F|nr:hypothetical protein [Aestuariimicrobium sp. T2.26MG-19.2B]